MLERLLVAVLLIVLGLGLYLGWTRLQLWRMRRVTANTPGLETLKLGRPAILYFTAPGCVPCRTVQRPALEALQAELGERLQVVTINAVERPEAANHWGVISAPTTFIVDRYGRARRVNHGVAGAGKLKQQLREIGELTDKVERGAYVTRNA
jgi:thiol-disulfide isomerase/thioredoxin